MGGRFNLFCSFIRKTMRLSSTQWKLQTFKLHETNKYFRSIEYVTKLEYLYVRYVYWNGSGCIIFFVFLWRVTGVTLENYWVCYATTDAGNLNYELEAKLEIFRFISLHGETINNIVLSKSLMNNANTSTSSQRHCNACQIHARKLVRVIFLLWTRP